METSIGYVPLKATITSGKGVIVQASSPKTGRATRAIIHWPDGCNALVDVAVGYEDSQFLPQYEDSYFSLNNATPEFPVDVPVKSGGKFWAKLQNRDSLNDHTITVIMTVEK